jgi:hypothetical protein
MYIYIYIYIYIHIYVYNIFDGDGDDDGDRTYYMIHATFQVDYAGTTTPRTVSSQCLCTRQTSSMLCFKYDTDFEKQNSVCVLHDTDYHYIKGVRANEQVARQ